MNLSNPDQKLLTQIGNLECVTNEDQGEYGGMLLGQLGEAGLPQEQTPFVLSPVDSVGDTKEKIQTQELHRAIIIPPDFSEKMSTY